MISLDDGRVLSVHDSGGGADRPAVVWHHGSPQTGAPLTPIAAAAAARGIRLVSYGRPSYGGSTPQPGRTVGSAAADVAAIADALGLDRFAAMGASGGGPHALACAALLGDRVTGAVSLAGLAPLTGGFDWWAGMVAPDGLRAALLGREARAEHAEAEEFDENSFTAADWDALSDRWSSLGTDATTAGSETPDGLVDDDVAFVSDWGFDLSDISIPTLIVHGGDDRVVPVSHGHCLTSALPNAELWLRPHAGHISILDAIPVALDWLRAR